MYASRGVSRDKSECKSRGVSWWGGGGGGGRSVGGGAGGGEKISLGGICRGKISRGLSRVVKSGGYVGRLI